jgi:hypothetical protein
MAGGLRRDERLKFIISGSASGATQSAAWNDAMCLANNVQHVLENYPSDGDNWSAGGLGWNYPESDESGDDFLEMDADPGTDGCVVHFTLMWSCDVRIERDSI